MLEKVVVRMGTEVEERRAVEAKLEPLSQGLEHPVQEQGTAITVEWSVGVAPKTAAVPTSSCCAVTSCWRSGRGPGKRP